MNTPNPYENYEQIRALVQNDLAEVDELILGRLRSGVPLINEVTNHLIGGGGKRIRPTLVLLSAKLCGYEGEMAIELATIIEYIHTATLLHDDVLDGSDLRRGKETANALWGNSASVLIGDFLYSRAFQMMVHLEKTEILGVLAKATNVIVEGEVLQLTHEKNPETTEETYSKVIYAKTAALFEVATQLGAVMSGRSPEEIKALADYGRHLGLAFQIIDDVLDYCSDAKTLGKNVGDDLADGKATLPFIQALKCANLEQKDFLRTALKEGAREKFNEVLKIIESTGAIEYTDQAAKQHIDKARLALHCFPDSEYRRALDGLLSFTLNRRY